MQLNTRIGLVGISALALLSLVHWARAQAVDDPPILVFMLGVTPSFAAAIAIPFVFLSIWLESSTVSSPEVIQKRFNILMVLSSIGLIGWEFGQTRSRTLFFDPNDLGSTVVGLAVGWLLFRWVRK